jgi:hypothetical protein
MFGVKHERGETHEKGKRALDRIGRAVTEYFRAQKSRDALAATRLE